MNKNARLSLLTLTVISAATIAWTAADQPVALQPNSRLWVDGTSSVRNYECKAGVIDLQAQASAPDVGHAVAGGGKAVVSVSLSVPVDKMDCANGTMNGHMKDALKAKDHANIEFNLTGYDLVKTADSAKITLAGTLTISGIAKTISIPAVATDAGNGVLRVTGSYDLLMSQYGVKPPSLMMGMMKVHDPATVHFDLLLKS